MIHISLFKWNTERMNWLKYSINNLFQMIQKVAWFKWINTYYSSNVRTDSNISFVHSLANISWSKCSMIHMKHDNCTRFKWSKCLHDWNDATNEQTDSNVPNVTWFKWNSSFIQRSLTGKYIVIQMKNISRNSSMKERMQMIQIFHGRWMNWLKSKWIMKDERTNSNYPNETLTHQSF